jgi:lipoyl(octanoyl) transferase
MQRVNYKDLGVISYKNAWDLQERVLGENLQLKSEARKNQPHLLPADILTQHHLFLCEHPPVFTLGKSGQMSNVLLTAAELEHKQIEFFKTNRGGDITFHGPQQLVGYPILDLEKMYTDIGRYLRNVEETVIKTIAAFGIKGERSKGETGVWIEPDVAGRERKICAIGVRCSRWITMHGFALNVNTDLDYFKHIIPCGIQHKQVTSMQQELGTSVNMEEVKKIYCQQFEAVFDVQLEG